MRLNTLHPTPLNQALSLPTPTRAAPNLSAASLTAPSCVAPTLPACSLTASHLAASNLSESHQEAPTLTAASRATPFDRAAQTERFDTGDVNGQPSASVDKAIKPEDGSVLPLLPVLIIICFFLGTLSVSTASTFLAKRELYNAAAAAANDAVSGISDVDYYTNSTYTFDPTNMAKLARQSIEARVGDTLRMRPEDIVITLEGERVRVTLEADFSPVFRGFLPGGLKKTRLKATALAEARTTP
jgi:hypothetical protein